MDRIVFSEPPRQGQALVIWPACPAPGYKITTAEIYWRDKLIDWPFRVTDRESLPAVIEEAKKINEGNLTIYVITD